MTDFKEFLRLLNYRQTTGNLIEEMELKRNLITSGLQIMKVGGI